MTRYAIVFILALTVATVLWGIERYYTMEKVHIIIKTRDCWRGKYWAARFGWPDERKCEDGN